ncbi:class I SAM-dependent methyltransferase [Thermaurantiacus sp.]
MADRLNFQVRSTHDYEPTYREEDLPSETRGARNLPGIHLDITRQLALLEQLRFGEELLEIPMEPPGPGQFGYRNKTCEEGVAEMLYSMIRHLKPRRIYEIGSGNSTLITRMAIAANAAEAPYSCEHLCIEPYEAPYLEQTGATVIRKRVEHLDLGLFRQLQADDILIIDSSHTIRPRGDVLFEILEILPSLAPGVYVSIDDIFTPYDYPEAWLRAQRRLWAEQYLLEAILSHNDRFEIVMALLWLRDQAPDAVHRAFPVLARNPQKSPGVMWIRRLS